jgi:carboxyl-terminal processing protease
MTGRLPASGDVMRTCLALLVVVYGVLGPAPVQAQSGPRNCTLLSQNMFVRDVLDEYYLWYRELPRANPANYATPEAYLEAVRYRPLDDTFSYITSRQANDAFYGESQFVGFGFSTQVSGRDLRVLQVFPDSPAAENGIARGDYILEVNGRSVGELLDENLLGSAFGAASPGVSATMATRSRDGVERRATLTKRVVTIPTVSLTQTFRVDGRTVGYLFFRNFVEPSTAALNEAFAALRDAGASELVVDVRYNGGGLVDVAVHLAALIGGVPTQGRVFATYQHNDRHPELNETIRFPDAPPQALNLSRVVVITTRASASASELLINSLRPHLPVVVIGDATYGKPVGQYGFTFCDKVVAPVAFALVNADERGDYFGGIAPDCRAADDVEHYLGEAEEASLGEALHFIRTGQCRTAATSRAFRAPDAGRPRAQGWDVLINAH